MWDAWNRNALALDVELNNQRYITVTAPQLLFDTPGMVSHKLFPREGCCQADP